MQQEGKSGWVSQACRRRGNGGSAQWGIYENQRALNDVWDRRRKIARKGRQFRRSGAISTLKPLFHFWKMESTPSSFVLQNGVPAECNVRARSYNDSKRLLTSVVSILTLGNIFPLLWKIIIETVSTLDRSLFYSQHVEMLCQVEQV